MTRFSRRAGLGLIASFLAAPARATPPSAGPRFGPPAPFGFAALVERARAIAARPFKPPDPALARALAALDYDALGAISFRREAALWPRDPGGAVELLHLGRYAATPVAIFVAEGGFARQVVYDEALFTGVAAGAAALPGFAGFRVLNPNGRGDWIAYQGASYFRSALPFDQYGLSARGLAIDTGLASPEEFPAFTAFWLERDAKGGLVVNALLEGPSVAGAYRIAHDRNPAGLTQAVEARLFFRRDVQRLGVAPLTSMYWYGQGDRPRAADWRPQIHDSDGLAMWTGAGERIWRPLANPPRLTFNAFQDRDPRGFGLMQRDRRFEDYQDDGVFYDRRPSLWVEPLGGWGAGSVDLVELPTEGETDDNIVAFWRPAAPPRAGEALTTRYRLHWTDEEPTAVGVARVVATRRGRGGRPGQAPAPDHVRFAVDFAGGALASLNDGDAQAIVESRPAPPTSVFAYRVKGTDRWRLLIEAPLAAGTRLDLRAFLRRGGEALSETWIYQAWG